MSRLWQLNHKNKLLSATLNTSDLYVEYLCYFNSKSLKMKRYALYCRTRAIVIMDREMSDERQ